MTKTKTRKFNNMSRGRSRPRNQGSLGIEGEKVIYQEAKLRSNEVHKESQVLFLVRRKKVRI